MRGSRNKFQSGGGGPGLAARIQSGHCFIFVCFLILNLFYSLSLSHLDDDDDVEGGWRRGII